MPSHDSSRRRLSRAAADRRRSDTLSPAEWGMVSFLLSEVAFFSTLIVTYVTFMGKDVVGPTPAEALSLPLVIVTTALPALEQRDDSRWPSGRSSAASSALFCLLVGGDDRAGHRVSGWARPSSGTSLIDEHHLTISRNLFGTTYYTLVGFHGLHVTVGVIVMLIVLALALRGEITRAASHGRRAGVAGIGTLSTRSGSSCSWWSTSPAGAGACMSTNRIRHRPTPSARRRRVDMPRPTAAPLVLALGIALLAAGVATSLAFLVVGGRDLRRRAGNVDRAAAARPRPRGRRAASSRRSRPQPVAPAPGDVERSATRACPAIACGCRRRCIPISAGIKGGIVGGLVMPLPALAYGLFSGHGIWCRSICWPAWCCRASTA